MLVMNAFRGRKLSYSVGQSLLLTVAVIAISFLGAKLLYYMEEPRELLQNGFRFGGVSFFGSVFLVPAAMLLVARLCKKDYDRIMDFLAPSLMLMLAILRVGCYLSACCEGVMIDISGQTVRFPAQLVECGYDILLMIGLLLYERLWKNHGRLYPLIMVHYGVFRFFLEFLRNTPKEWLGFSHGQWFSVISVCIGGCLMVRLGKREKKAQRKVKSAKKGQKAKK